MPQIDAFRRLVAATAQPWAASRADLEREYSRRALDRALRVGIVTRVAPGTYVPGAFATSLFARCVAAHVAAGGRGAIGGMAALALWGSDEPPPAHIMVVLGRHDHVAGLPADVMVYRTDHQPATAMLDGIAVSMPHWAVAQALREVPKGRRRALAIAALGQGICEPSDVADVVASHPRLLGVSALRGALAAYAEGSHSPLEDDATQRVLVGGLRRLSRQHVLVVEGRVLRLDAFDEASRVAIEFDGYAFHGGRLRWQADRERDVLLAGIGITTLRFTYADVTSRPEWCTARIWAAIEARAAGREAGRAAAREAA